MPAREHADRVDQPRRIRADTADISSGHQLVVIIEPSPQLFQVGSCARHQHRITGAHGGLRKPGHTGGELTRVGVQQRGMAKPGHSGLRQLSHHSPNLSPMSFPAAPQARLNIALPSSLIPHCPARTLS